MHVPMTDLMEETTMERKNTPLSAMLWLMRQNAWSFAGAMVASVMIVIIGFLTPLLLAETDRKSVV